MFGARLQNAQFSLELHQPLRQGEVVGGELRRGGRLHGPEYLVIRSMGKEAAVPEVDRRAQRGVGLVGGLSQQERGAGAARSRREEVVGA